MKIDIGTKLICTAPNLWCDNTTLAEVTGPVDGDILTVRRIGVELVEDEWVPVVWFEEWPGDAYEDAYEVQYHTFEVFAPEQ